MEEKMKAYAFGGDHRHSLSARLQTTIWKVEASLFGVQQAVSMSMP